MTTTDVATTETEKNTNTTEGTGVRVARALNVVKTPSIVGHEVGLWKRFFTKEGVHPFDEVKWKVVDGEILGADGTVVWERKSLEVPDWWDQNTVNIICSKYFRNVNGRLESSVKQMISRVVAKLVEWAVAQDYFNSDKDAEVYSDELCYALLHQYGAFNSPVWFNLGVPDRKQMASACFISHVDDSLEAITKFAATELTIFAGGSGSGANLSDLRSSYERLSTGAFVSGPIAWMRMLDQGALAMKSGGSTRNAAKMIVLDIDHPDIMETMDGRPGFIRCKAVEEKRAHDLIDAGYSAAFDDPNSAYKSVMFQNANHSLSVSDDFMKAVEGDGKWVTRSRFDGSAVGEYDARKMWQEIAQATWTCGDPGIQFTDTINRWHTVPHEGRIRSSNPCSEFLHVDNTACNLCALNLLKFFDIDRRVMKVNTFGHVIRLFVTAQNAIIARADYPTDEIRVNSHRLRPIGLNYGNLGSVIMRMGLGYDSDSGRAVAARAASLMTGLAYLTSAKLAARVGSFDAFKDNREEMLEVMKMHLDADSFINGDPMSLAAKSADVWAQVIELGSKYGFTNSQTTLQAPLGTLSFLLEADTTGIEPAFSLVSYKSLVGGGSVKLVNQSVRDALKTLGYGEDATNGIISYIMEHDTIEGAPNLLNDHLHVFDCAMPSGDGKRFLSPLSHLKMMGSIQPLITCAQSKTVNLPKETTVDEIASIYMEAWKMGLKCVALYRDGSKRTQPLSSKVSDGDSKKRVAGHRSPMPVDANGHRHRFVINGGNGNTKGYIMVNEYPDGAPGEVFLKIGKSGSTVAGLVDGFTQLLSIALQWGVPLDKMIRSFVHTKFEPAGMTKNAEIRFTDSLYDYLFKFLDARYYGGLNSGIANSYGNGERQSLLPSSIPPISASPEESSTDAPPCVKCGAITRRNGTCYICSTCGTSSGCS